MIDAEAKLDAAIATGAATSWWWLPHFDNTLHIMLGVGGLVLLALRVLIAWREWRSNKGGR